MCSWETRVEVASVCLIVPAFATGGKQRVVVLISVAGDCGCCVSDLTTSTDPNNLNLILELKIRMHAWLIGCILMEEEFVARMDKVVLVAVNALQRDKLDCKLRGKWLRVCWCFCASAELVPGFFCVRFCFNQFCLKAFVFGLNYFCVEGDCIE